MNVSTEGLPPEMQQRIADIIEKAKATTPQAAAPQQQAPIQRPPTLMDHTVALRQEVAALRQELNAVAQVTDAVGISGIVLGYAPKSVFAGSRFKRYSN